MDQNTNACSGQTTPGANTYVPTSNFKQLEAELAKLYSKITFHIPPAGREFIVHYGPWITLVLMFLAVPAILLALGLTAAFSPFAGMYGVKTGGMFFVSGLISLGVLALEGIALPALFKRQISGWNFVFYASLLSAVGNLLSMNWFGLILGTAVSMYILFEIKSYYK
jgi:hypothetical protein